VRFILPRSVFNFDGSLRFHAYETAQTQRYGSYEVATTAPTVRLVVAVDTPTMPRQLYPEALDVRSWVGGVTQHSADGRSFASAFSTGTSAVLTWQCIDGEPGIVFSAARGLRGAPEMSAAFGTSDAQHFGTWTVVHNLSDAAVAPSSVIAAFTRAARTSATVLVRASTEESVPQGHSFNLGGLDEALQELACLGQASRRY